MPMFDDPRRELNRLQQELLAQEEEDFEEEEALPGDFDEELEDILELIGDSPVPKPRQEPAYRNYANNYGRSRQESWEDAPALYADEYEEPAPRKKQKKEKGIRGLVFLAILETLGILAIAAWWVNFLWL